MADYSKESNLRQVAMLTPGEQATEGNDDEDRRTLLGELGRASDPRVKAVLQREYDRRFNGDVRTPAVATSMRDGFPELRAGAPGATPRAPAPSGLAAFLHAGAPGATAPRASLSDFLDSMPEAPPAPAKSGTMRRLLGDSAVSLGRGVVGVPEALTGIADLATGGRAGKAMQDLGVDYKGAKDIIGDYYSPEQKAANEAVAKAQGFLPTARAMLENPSTIVQQAIESAPSMLPGAGVARGALAVAPKIGPILAGAIGEGATAAGQNAEQVRQEDPNGTLTAKQSAILAASGLATGAIGFGAGKVANKLGIGDLHTMLAAGKMGAVGDEAIATGSVKGLVRKAMEGGLTEGILQELPQSYQEQVAQNIAQGKPWNEGAAAAGAQGMLAGGLMGAVGGPLDGRHESAKSAGDVIREDLQPGTGPTVTALNAGIEDAARKADAAQVAAPDANVPHPPRPATAEQIAAIRKLAPDQQEDALKLVELGNRADVVPGVRRHAQARLDALLGDLQPLNPTVIDDKTGEPKLEPVPTVAEAKPGNTADQALARTESTLRAGDAAAAAQREADRPSLPEGEQQDGDILNKAGKPFTTMPGAMTAMQRAGDGHELVRVADGLVVRKTTTKAANELGEPTGSGSDQGAPTAVAAAPGGTGPVVRGESASGPSGGPVAEPVAGAAGTDRAGGVGTAGDSALTTNVFGEHIADGWHAFTPESGTKGIPRADMPQIKAEHRGAMTNFLNARGIAHEQVELPAGSIKPTQTEFSPEKVEKARTFSDTDRSILISSDGHVLDGHHQWLAKLADNAPIKAIRLDAPIEQLLPIVREFPSATVADGATQASTPANEPNAEAGTGTSAEAAPQAADAAGTAPAVAGAKRAGPAATRPAKVEPDGLKRPHAAGDSVSIHFPPTAGHPNGYDATGKIVAIDGDRYRVKPNGSKEIEVGAERIGVNITQALEKPGKVAAVSEPEPVAPADSKKESALERRKRLIAERAAAAPAVPEVAPAVARAKEKRAVPAPSPTTTPAAVAEPGAASPTPAKPKRTTAANAAPSEKPAGKASEPAKTIADAGEKIGGARKDRWKDRGLDVSDLDAMSESEGAELATKANVWKPDYAAMVDAGTPPKHAALVKVIYDRLAAQPAKNTPEGRRQYVTTMQAVRAAFGSLDGTQSPRRAAEEARSTLYSMLGIKASNGMSADRATPEQQAARAALFSVYKGRSDPFSVFYDEERRADKMVADGFPEKGEPWKRRFQISRAGGAGVTEAGVAAIVKQSAALGTPLTEAQARAGVFAVVRTVGRKFAAMAATQADAEVAAKTVYTSSLAKDAGEDPERPHLDNIKREGLPKTIDRDVTQDDFLQHFGFRGVEFGNWSAQDERQKLLNLAYDGLNDLANILGVPAKAMSLNGTMGMAFGARGGGRFAAHYEPGKLVINMTKIRGGGSLAHEWAHAFDHYLGELDTDNAYKSKARGASGWTTRADYQIGKMVRDGVDDKGRTKWKQAERLPNLRPELSKAIDAVMHALYGGRGMGASQYAKEAQKLSGKSTDGYWIRPTEMWARAFESYAFDKLVAMGAKSDYLVHGVEGERFAAADRYKGNPYPVGEERAKINATFDALMATIKMREADDGNVAMFSRAADSPESRALKALSESDALFRLPKSSGDTVAGIAADIDPQIKVRKITSIPGETRYDLTMPDGNHARMTVRPINPYGPSRYGFDYAEGEISNVLDERPGDNPDDVPPTEDLWVDVSLLKTGGGGVKVYAIAANYAHNTGRIFIGDPAGLSNEAMVRRPEQMLSSALKFGTTEHLAPHPRQVTGDVKLGVPPLRWVYGDDLGNIRRLIDLNLAVQENAGTDEITFDPSDGQFHDSTGAVIDRAGIGLLAKDSGLGSAGLAGGDTIARSAVLRALLREEGGGSEAGGQRDGLLDRLAGLGSDPSSSARRIFYSRNGVDPEQARAERAAEVQTLVEKITARWKNAPEVVVVQSLQDENVPEAVRQHDNGQRSEGAEGDIEGFYYKGKVYLIADKLGGDADVLRVLMHESLGHYGLRTVFGQQLGTILDRMAVLQAGKVRDKARQYGLDFEKQKERRAAAEEVLAELAQTNPQLGWVQQAIAAIRTWIRENIPGAHAMKLSDAEVIRSYIIPARQFVKAGELTVQRAAAPAARNEPMFSRSLGAQLGEAMNNVKDVNLPAGYKVADLMDSAGKLSFWHKTVGTPFNLAERSPTFKRVYDATQNFLNDASFYANDAANLAPTILPKLETWKDIAKSPMSAVDTKALAAPIFEGTLLWTRDEKGKPIKVADKKAAADAMDSEQKARALFKAGHLSEQVLKMWQGLPIDQFETTISAKYERDMLKEGVVWTPDEIKSQFNATGEKQADGSWSGQIGLYNEFRASTDHSLTHLAISEMLRNAGKDADAVRAQVLELGDADKAGLLLRDHLFAMADTDEARADVLNATANRMIDIADHATDMKARGYAPLSRFGTFTLEATLATGERYFSLFETPRERARMQRMLAADGATGIQAGTMSQEDYKLLNGVSPETIALFGEMLGLDSQGSEAKDIAFQTYVKRGTANRSAMKRLLKRQGIAGFSEDAGRVLAGFVYSNGRRTSGNLHMAEIDQSVNDMDKQGGELKDAAVQLTQYVKNPQEEAQGLRGLLFAQYLGGSVASAMVNATQPFAVTFPYLSQFGGIGKAAKQMAAAVKVAGKKTTGDAVLDAALHKAEEDGIVSPQEVHQLQAQAQGRSALKSGDGTVLGNAGAKASNVLSKVTLAWGKVFGVAEQFNRRVTFIAAYRTAVDQGIADPAAFAAHAIAETQFTYNKGNKPKWARGAIGGTLFTFKQYSVNYLELLSRMATSGEPGSPERAAGRKAALLAVAVLFLMSGTDGLPFEANIEDLIDGFMQHMGYNFSSKRAKQEFFANLLGEDGGRFVNKGLSGLPGAPIDVSGRMGMGRLIPGTGLLTKKADHGSDVAELLGPAGDLAKRTGQATGQLLDGDIGAAAASLSPVATRNVRQAVDMVQHDAYRDAKGRKVIDTTLPEAILKGAGFQPNSVARVQEAAGEVQQSVALTKLRQSELTADYAQAVFEKDTEKMGEVRAMMKRWNEANPEATVKINMAGVLQRVKAMREDKATRLEKTAPAGMRADVRRQLEGAT